ncbi:hypothetical protein [Bradyrhizobium sp.]|uniref:hypothetical protein n=1 Tax=Bradyrhizobium sp. TaxID=376 RepID=UPI0025BB7DE6|nr:hypothetical protein [Bradyrhizobium sp.]MBV8923017.1 hypothetical protein [Bradyrhizobium sp.]
MPTLAHCFAKEFTPYLEALWESSPQFRQLVSAYKGFFERIGLSIRLIAESPPSRGYEPILMQRFGNRIAARGMAMMAVRSEKQRAGESKRRAAVVGALRFLAKREGRADARLRRVSLLLAAWEETSIIDDIFDEVGVSQPALKEVHPNPFEFVSLLRSVVERREISTSRLRQIAADIAPHIVNSRGPKISAASAAHELILETVFLDGPSAYTWDPIKGDFSDGLTQATRLEFGNPNFSPQPARRRARKRRVSQ